LFLFDVASRHMTWLAQRQSVTAANIVNANTPGYRAQDVASFSSVLDTASSAMSVTSPLHMTDGGSLASRPQVRNVDGWGSAHSGNTVSIERELMTASSNSRMMTLDVTLARSFHRMILSSVKV
jgi:flagellar basal-body rod protein FlgB